MALFPTVSLHPIYPVSSIRARVLTLIVKFLLMTFIIIHIPGTSTGPTTERWTCAAAAGSLKCCVVLLIADRGRGSPRWKKLISKKLKLMNEIPTSLNSLNVLIHFIYRVTGHNATQERERN